MAKKTKNKSTQQLQHELAQVQEKYHRAVADYQNLEKRSAQQRSEYIRLANAELIGSFLHILDDLERAAQHIQDKGLDMVINNFYQTLAQAGVQPIKAQGETFDPNLMECTDTVPGKKDQVVKVIQTGFTLGDTVIRPAKVQVGQGKNKH